MKKILLVSVLSSALIFSMPINSANADGGHPDAMEEEAGRTTKHKTYSERMADRYPEKVEAKRAKVEAKQRKKESDVREDNKKRVKDARKKIEDMRKKIDSGGNGLYGSEQDMVKKYKKFQKSKKYKDYEKAKKAKQKHGGNNY